MIKVKSKIKINSSSVKIWNFLNDLSMGLSFNRFHKKIKTDCSFKLDTKSQIIIEHNFGFGSYEMILSVLEILPNQRIIFEEKAKNKSDQLFFHKTEFEIIEESQNLTLLNYEVSGTFDNKFADLSFKPILKGVMLDELLKIKIAIESSDSRSVTKQYNPV